MKEIRVKNRGRRMFLRILIILILIFVSLFFLISKSAQVQTYIANQVISHLKSTKSLGVRFKQVDFNPFESLTIDEVFIPDHRKDTLFYANKIAIDISWFQWNAKAIDFSSLRIHQSYFRQVHYKGDSLSNLAVFLNQFESDDDSSSFDWSFSLKYAEFTDARALIWDENQRFNQEQFHYRQFELNQVELQIEDFIYADNKVSADLRSLAADLDNQLVFELKDWAMEVSNDELLIDKALFSINQDSVLSKLSFDGKYHFKTQSGKLNTQADVQTENLSYFLGKDYPNTKVWLDLALENDSSGIYLKDSRLKVNKESYAEIQGVLKDWKKNDWNYNIELTNSNITKSDCYDWLRYLKLSPSDIRKTVGKNLLASVYVQGNSKMHEADIELLNQKDEIQMKIVAEHNSDWELKGNVRSNRVVLSKWWSDPLLVDRMSLNHTFKLDIGEQLILDVLGYSSFIRYKGYDYQNVSVEANGDLSDLIYHVVINDENANFKLDGSLVRKDDHYKVLSSGFVNAFKPVRLGLVVDRDSSMNLTTQFFTSIDWKNLQEFEADLRITNYRFNELFYRYNLDEILIETKNNQDTNWVDIQSDWLNVSVNGKYEFKDFPKYVNALYQQELSFLENEETTKPAGLNYEIEVIEPFPFIRMFDLPFRWNGLSSKGNYNYQLNELTSSLSATELNYQGRLIHDFKLDVLHDKNGLQINASGDSLELPNELVLKDVYFRNNLKGDYWTSSLQWEDSTNTVNSGNLNVLSDFSDFPKVKVSMNQASFWLDDKKWSFSNSTPVIIDTAFIQFNEFKLFHDDQLFLVNGIAGSSRDQVLSFSLEQFNLNTFQPFLDQINLKIGGVMDGKVDVASILKSPETKGELKVNQFSMNGLYYDDLTISAEYLNELEKVVINGRIANDNNGRLQKPFVINGDYYPFKDEDNLDVRLHLENFNIKNIGNYLESFASKTRGYVDGDLYLKGTPSDFYLDGELALQSFGSYINYLGVSVGSAYEKVYFDQEGIHFKNFRIEDDNLNHTLLNGSIRHNSFRSLALDLNFDMHDFLCLNTTREMNELFYGTMIADGEVQIMGEKDFIIINIQAETKAIKKGKNDRITSHLSIPLDNQMELKDNDFIQFVKPKGMEVAVIKEETDFSGMEVNMDIEVHPETELKLIFDSKVGDEIRAKGYSNFKLNINSLGKFSMYGDYVMSEGDYLFTLENVVNKKFKVNKGSKVSWKGDPYNADVDINAFYQVKTSLFDLLQYTVDQSGDSTIVDKRYEDLRSEYGGNSVVHCTMDMTGDLMQPNILMGLDFPDIDEKAQLEIDNMINTEDEKMKQVVSLMLWGRFMPPAVYAGAGQGGFLNAGVTSTTDELLSNQVDLWLSQLSDEVSLGFNYDRAQTDNGRDEMSLEVGKQLSDKMTFSTNLGVANRNQESGFIGEFELNYRLTENIRLKGFNKNNDIDPTKVTGYTQGASIMYQADFNRFSELLEPYRKIKLVFDGLRTVRRKTK